MVVHRQQVRAAAPRIQGVEVAATRLGQDGPGEQRLATSSLRACGGASPVAAGVEDGGAGRARSGPPRARSRLLRWGPSIAWRLPGVGDVAAEGLVEKEAFVQPKKEQLSRAHYSPGLKGALVPGRKAQSPCEAGLPLVPGR